MGSRSKAAIRSLKKERQPLFLYWRGGSIMQMHAYECRADRATRVALAVIAAIALLILFAATGRASDKKEAAPRQLTAEEIHQFQKLLSIKDLRSTVDKFFDARGNLCIRLYAIKAYKNGTFDRKFLVQGRTYKEVYAEYGKWVDATFAAIDAARRELSARGISPEEPVDEQVVATTR